MKTWNETRKMLICAGLNPAAVPDVWEYGANLTGADLRGANLTGADLRWANLTEADLRWANLTWTYLRWANLTGTDLRGTYLSWQSHDLIAEILRRSAGDDLQKRMLAGLPLVSRDWCWNQFLRLEVVPELRDWALGVLAEYVIAGDDAPAIIRRIAEKRDALDNAGQGTAREV